VTNSAIQLDLADRLDEIAAQIRTASLFVAMVRDEGSHGLTLILARLAAELTELLAAASVPEPKSARVYPYYVCESDTTPGLYSWFVVDDTASVVRHGVAGSWSEADSAAVEATNALCTEPKGVDTPAVLRRIQLLADVWNFGRVDERLLEAIELAMARTGCPELVNGEAAK